MASTTYRPVCLYCGISGGQRSSGSAGGPPTITPHLSGKCPSSPTGKHAPRWEVA